MKRIVITTALAALTEASLTATSTCRQALIDGILEPREMPHAETLYIMQLMDGLRRKWDVRYPMD